MQTTLESAGAHRVKLTIEVAPDEFGKDLDRAYRRIAEQVRIPGFRTGKAPRKVIDAQIGRDAVLEEFIEITIPAYYRDALREHDLAPIGDPDISLDAVDIASPLRFTAEVEVRPRLTFTQEEYRGLAVERPTAAVAETDVDAALERLRDRFAELETVERPLADGDYAVVDIRAMAGGEEVADLTRPDALYEVGSGSFVTEFDTELRGKRAGDILRFTSRLDERAGERAGTDVEFTVLVKDVKAKKLPPLDDELAKLSSEFDTLTALREALRGQLVESRDRAADAIVRDRVLAAMVEKVTVDLPESLVADETEHRVAHARENALRAGLTLEQALAAQGFDEARFREDARAHAIRAITQDLALEAVARTEDIEVTPEELGREVASIAASLGRDPKEVATSLDRSGQIVALAGDIIRSKALDILVEHAAVTPEVASGGAAPAGESRSEGAS
ncbi:MAG: trigger factor [Actinomycetota bacterium]